MCEIGTVRKHKAGILRKNLGGKEYSPEEYIRHLLETRNLEYFIVFYLGESEKDLRRVEEAEKEGKNSNKYKWHLRLTRLLKVREAETELAKAKKELEELED